MTRFFAVFFAMTLTFALPLEAEAKRFGGGFSLGKSYNTAPRKAPDSTQQASPSPANPAGAATAAKTGMGAGLVGGLLAGGLFGALLFGGAFEGIQLMDLLLIALVGFVLFKLFAARRPQTAYAGAGGAPQGQNAQRTELRDADFGYQERRSVSQSASAESGFFASQAQGFAQPAQIETPDWFNREAFLAAAPDHFKSLQRAWDEQNWDEIASYTSDELLSQLKTNRSVLPDNQKTDVVSVMVELVGFQEDATEAVVSLNFHGWIRENGAADTTEFSEVWHLLRTLDEHSEGWQLVGIEQD